MIPRDEAIISDSMMQYFEAAPQENMLDALKNSTKQFKKLLRKIPKKKIDYAYAEGKWTIREVLQHIIDAERVFSFRALWFSRHDVSPLPAFDENSWAASSKADARRWKDLVEEFFTLRAANQMFFESLDDEQLKAVGTANNKQMNPAGLGFVSAGHVMHHIRIVKERYLAKKQPIDL